jgi:hypothetical protein
VSADFCCTLLIYTYKPASAGRSQKAFIQNKIYPEEITKPQVEKTRYNNKRIADKKMAQSVC